MPVKYYIPSKYYVGRLLIAFLFLVVHATNTLGVQQGKPAPAELTIYANSTEGPVEGAVVVLRSLGKQRLNVTGTGGACRFTRLNPGTYSIQVTLPPFFVASEVEGQLDNLELTPGQRQSISLRLIKGGVISGRLLGSNGLPIIGIPATALKVTEGIGRPGLPSLKESNVTALTDDRGEFRIYGLRPGSYVVAINAQRNSYQLRSVKTEYYPGQPDLLNATIFALVAGQEITLSEMVMDLNSGAQSSLSATVLSERHLPLEGVSLSVHRVDGNYLSDSGVTDRKGLVSFEGLSSGRYLIKAAGAKGEYFGREKEITITDFVSSDVILELDPYPTIAGNAYIRRKNTRTQLPSLAISLVPTNGEESIDLASDTDGVFSARLHRDGSFLWRFPRLRRENYLERIDFNGKDITYQPLQVLKRSDLKGISLQFAEGAVTIRGLFDPRGRSACATHAVYAVALNKSTKDVLFARRADECLGTSFSIYSLPAGRYFVVAMMLAQPAHSRVQLPQNNFLGVDDRHFRVIETTAHELDKSNIRLLATERERTYSEVVPIILGSEGLRPTAP